MNKITQTDSSRGAALLIFVVLFMISSVVVATGISRMIYVDVLKYRTLTESKESFYTAESSIEDVVYRYRNEMNVSATESLTLGAATVDTTITDVFGTIEVTATAIAQNAVRKSYVELEEGRRFSFEYGLFSSVGGIVMENSSSVTGDVYANGSLEGSNNNVIDGDAISAGPSGLIDGANVTGSAWAHTIMNSDIGGDAYFQVSSGNSVTGTEYPGSADLAFGDFLITDEQIDDWEQVAEDGGVILSTDPECAGGTYIIDSDTTLGPIKIECNIFVDKASTNLYLEGVVWVVGDVITQSGPTIHIAGSASGKTFPLIADNPSDRLTGSQIILQNNAVFNGAGADSYIVLISRNNSAENGGAEIAIHAQNSASGNVLFYTLGGEVAIENNTSLKEITAYRIRTRNNAEVIFESGLTQLLVSTGPDDPYALYDWQEIE